jgi:hypothetical protein
LADSPERIRTAVAGSKGQNVNHYTTGPKLKSFRWSLG